MPGIKKSYFKNNFDLDITLLGVLTAWIFAGAIAILYHSGIIDTCTFYLLFLPNILISFGAIPGFTYPEVSDDSIEIKWIGLSFLNKKFHFKDIDHILFLRKPSYGAHFNITIYLNNGRKHKYYDLLGMKTSDLGSLVHQLQDLGLKIENKLRDRTI